MLFQYSYKMNSFYCCVNTHTQWIALTVVSIFMQNEFLWLLWIYSYTVNSFDDYIHTKWITLTVVPVFTQNTFLWLLCQYSHKMNSFDCYVNIHTQWIPLTVWSVFTPNEFLWLLCQYSQKMNSFDCCVSIHTKWIPFPANLSSSARSHAGSLFTNEDQKKLALSMILLLHIPALFMTPLTQTAGHKMAARTLMFSRLSNVGF